MNGPLSSATVQSRLNSKSEHPGGGDVVVSPFLHERIPKPFGLFTIDPDLVAEVAGIAGSGNHDRDPSELRVHEPEIPQLLDGAARALQEDGPGRRSLEGERTDFFRHILD